MHMYRRRVKYTIVFFLIVLFCMTLLSCSQKAAVPMEGPAPSETEPVEGSAPSETEPVEGSASSKTKPDLAGETAKEAVKHYMEFLKKEDMYELTASPPYPRGDSRAAYAIGDSTGDGVPELHLEGGGHYYIYTYREGEVALLLELILYQQLTPAKDGTLVLSKRVDSGPDTIRAEYRIPPEEDLAAEKARLDGSTDYYEVIRLLPDGSGGVNISRLHSFSKIFRNNRGFAEYVYSVDGEACTAEEWEIQVGILNDKSKQLAWTAIFPREEWDYLDAKEEGSGDNSEEDSEEWRFYKRILSGDFSLIEMEDRGRLASFYESSLDPSTGRSNWKYILLDFNGDGIRDLFIQFDSDSSNYTSTDFYDNNVSRGVALICYSAEKTKCMISDGITGVRMIPLKNGQIIWLEGYAATRTLLLGRMERDTVWHETEKEFTILHVSYDIGLHYNEDWYEEWYGPGRKEGETYYFVQNYDDGHPEGVCKELSKEEWRRLEEWMGALLIPDSQWEPASVFLPERYPISFSQG